jgi:hypothetical protein
LQPEEQDQDSSLLLPPSSQGNGFQWHCFSCPLQAPKSFLVFHYHAWDLWQALGKVRDTGTSKSQSLPFAKLIGLTLGSCSLCPGPEILHPAEDEAGASS